MSNPIIDPAEGIAANLAKVDARFEATNRDLPPNVASAFMALAQVHATCALVHAVRELTDEVRKLGETP